MTPPFRFPRRSSVLALVGLLLVANSSFAGEGIFSSGVGARAMSLGGADVASGDGPLSALGTNPAALSLLSQPRFDAGFTSAVATGHFSSRVSDQSSFQNRLEFGPAAAFGFRAGSSPVSFGIGVIPQAGLSAHWHYLDPPGGLDGRTSYGVQKNNSEIRLLRSAVGMSLALSRWVSIGGTVGYSYNENLLQTPYILQSQPALRGLKTLLDLKTNGWGWNAGVGLLVCPNPDWQFGLSYLSPTLVDSRGDASGNAGVQLKSLGLAGVRPDFHYKAEVDTHFPQMVTGGFSWKFQPQWRLLLQVDWVNWSDAFDVLPVKFSHGNNEDLNAIVGASRFEDDIPLRWRDRLVYHGGLEYAVTENCWLRCGYSYGQSPVPSETLTPLTALIPEHTLTAGAGYRWRGFQVDLAYQWELPTTRHVGRSALQSGEYSDSNTRIGIHWFGLTTSVRF